MSTFDVTQVVQGVASMVFTSAKKYGLQNRDEYHAKLRIVMENGQAIDLLLFGKQKENLNIIHLAERINSVTSVPERPQYCALCGGQRSGSYMLPMMDGEVVHDPEHNQYVLEEVCKTCQEENVILGWDEPRLGLVRG